jgi:hypothetical protein
MADVRAILSDKALLFMNVTPKGANPTWALMNKGIESAEIAYNPKEAERHFIADTSATKLTTGLAKTLDQTQYAYKGDEVFEYVDDLIFEEAIGDDAITQILEVFIYRTTDMSATSNIPSKVQNANISIASKTLTGGEQMQIGYNVNFSGNPSYGTASVVDGKAIFTEGS